MLASVSGRTIPRRATTPRVAACAFSSMAMTLLGGRDGSGSDSGNNRNRYTGSSNRNSSCSSRSHYNYAGPGRFSQEAAHDRHVKRLTQQNSWFDRGFTVGIGGPVGSGKTALVLALIKRLAAPSRAIFPQRVTPKIGVVTNDIFTQEDAQFLVKQQDVLAEHYIRAVETGGCPHAAIREDVSANLTACEELTQALLENTQTNTYINIKDIDEAVIKKARFKLPPIIFCESGGDNLAANFSNELADLTLYVIDVAGGDKIPRKGGPGITQSDLLIINKIDLADAVGASLDVMQHDAATMRSSSRSEHNHSHDHNHHDPEDGNHQSTATTTTMVGPTVLASVRDNVSIDDIEQFILDEYYKAIAVEV